jgi:hypothetical protein
LLIQSLHQELGEDEDAEFDEEDDPHTCRIQRVCEKRVSQYEVHLHELDKDMQKKIDHQVELLEKTRKDLADAREGRHYHVQRAEALRIPHSDVAI